MRYIEFNKKDISLERFVLDLKVENQNISDKYSHVEIGDNKIKFIFVEDITEEEQNIITQKYLAHDPSVVDIENVIKNRILFSMELGAEMMARFGAENKAMTARGELSQNDLFTLSFILKDLQLLVISGSLEMAAYAWSTLPVMDGLSLERKQKYARIIAEYLEQVRIKYPLPGEGQ